MKAYQYILDYGGPLVYPIDWVYDKELRINYEEYIKKLPSLLPFIGVDGKAYTTINDVLYKEIEII